MFLLNAILLIILLLHRQFNLMNLKLSKYALNYSLLTSDISKYFAEKKHIKWSPLPTAACAAWQNTTLSNVDPTT